MAEDNKQNLEKDIRNLTDQIDIKRRNLDSLTQEFGELEQEIEILYHSIFQKNNEIQAIEDDEKDQFKDNAARQQFELEVKKEQLDQLIKTKIHKTSEKSRMLVQEFYLSRFKIHSEKLLSQQVKLEVQSVKIMSLTKECKADLENKSRNYTTIRFEAHTFSINKKTLIKNLFEQATDYFKIAAKHKYVLTDTNFNDLTLLYNFPAEQYFCSLKEQCLYAELYLKPKNEKQAVLFDKQLESIQLVDGVSSLQTTTDTEKKNLLTIFSNFEKVFNGIQLYSTQAKNDSNVMILQKVKSNFWLNLFHIIIYLTIIIALFVRLTQTINTDVYNIKENSKYFLQTFSALSQPIQDGKFFLKSLNGFSRSFKYPQNDPDIRTSDPKPQDTAIFSNFISLGAVRIVLKKTKVKQCNTFSDYYQISEDQYSKFQCSEPIVNSNTETKEKINGLSWTSEDENDIDSVDGFLGTYSGGGYKIDFDPYIFDIKVYDQIITKMESYIDYQTKVAIVYGAFYDISQNYFLSVYYIVDITSGGIYVEGQDVQYFQLFYSDQMDSQHKSAFNTSIACIVLMSVIFIISIFQNIHRTYQTYQLNKKHKLNFKARQIYFKLFSFQLITELGILIAIIVSHIFIYLTPDKSFQQLTTIQYPEFVNIHKYGYMQKVGNQLLALSLILLVLFFFINIPLNFELKNYQRMIQNSLGPLIVLIILNFTLICSIALVLQRVFGPYLVEFTLYGSSFCETILVYFFGDYQIQQSMWEKNKVLSFVLVGIVFLSMFYGSIALFSSVLFEKYRLVSTKLQFNDQEIDVADQLNEKLKNLKSISCWKCFQKDDKKSQKKSIKKQPKA